MKDPERWLPNFELNTEQNAEDTKVTDLSKQPLHICVNDGCDCNLVRPVKWDEALNDHGRFMHWEITLYCPECQTFREGNFSEEQVGELDAELNEGVEWILRAIKNVSRQNMEDDVDRFINALNKDAIQPMDF